MPKHAFRAIAVLAILMIFVFGLGAISCAASESDIPATEGEIGAECCPVPPVCTCEPIYAIVGCGECTKCDERTIQLCPPARTLGTITKVRVIDFVQVLNGKVIVYAHVDKFINYTDISGVPRIRFVRIPFTCEIPIPGIVETDTVAFQQLTITSETDTLSCDGRSLDERLCVRINVSIQRILDCRLVCPNS